MPVVKKKKEFNWRKDFKDSKSQDGVTQSRAQKMLSNKEKNREPLKEKEEGLIKIQCEN